MNQNYLQIKSALGKKEDILYHSDAGFGVSLLTFPGMSSSSRSVMFSSHIRQHMVLKNPDSPRMFTNYENIFGKLSSGYTEAKNRYEIIARIPKYSWLPNYMYTLILWNINEKRYEIFEKKHIENLTEKYAYEYKSNIDNKFAGDIIENGEVLWQSTSYDNDMNFGYGKNMNIAYVYDIDTIEDAIKITDVAARKMCSKEAEVISIPLNDNDFLGNFYGDKNQYKVIPDIGENIKDHILCFKRRKFNNQILYDFKDSNLRKPNFSGDTPYYNDGVIEDITIYCNKEIDEIDDIEFNDQLKKYLKEQNRYWTEIKEALEDIISSGKDMSTDINYFYKRASQILDPEFKWKPDDKMFSNMIIEITISRDDYVGVGSKLAGRCGNKGVVSKVIPQEESYYYYLADGTKVYADIIVNALGVINRTNAPQLYELDLNNFADRIIECIHFDLETLAEKEKMFFKFYEIVNHIQGDALRKYYDGLGTTERKKKFFENAYKEKLYIHVPPFWQVDDESLLYKLINLLREFGEEFADRQTYVYKHGREIKTLRNISIGSEYFMKLRQNSKKAFSACSLTSINEQSLPMKSKRAKDGLELYPKAPVRFGVQETTNFLIGVDPEVLAKLSHVYRSSTAARRALGLETITNTRELETIKLTEEMTNVNVEILDAYLKAIGYKVEFSDKFKDNLIDVTADTVIYERVDEEDGTVFLGTDKEYFEYKIRKDIKKDLQNQDILLTRIDYEDMIETLVAERKDAIMKGEIRFEL